MAPRLINPNHAQIPLYVLSLGLLGYGLATSDWPCGNLFTECTKTIWLWIVLILVGGGAGGLAVIFLVDLCNVCKSSMFGPVCNTFKMLLLTLFSASTLTGLMLYTYWYLSHWSYVMSILGAAFSVQVVLLTCLKSRCLHSSL